MFKFKKQAYSEDMFADTRMSFGDHLEDLRTHLWRAIKGFLLIIVGVFALDGIGLATGWRFPFTSVPIGIGRPMLEFINAPAEEQLVEFHERKVQKMLEELESNEKLKAANRRKWVKIGFPVGLLEGFKESDLRRPLPARGKPLSYPYLIARAQYQANAASEAFQRRKWKEITALAELLNETAQRFDEANKIPEESEAEIGGWANGLADQADKLEKAAKAENSRDAENSLTQIQATLGDKGMETTLVPFEEPLVFSAEMSRAIGTTQGHYSLATFSVMEAFMAYFKVALMCGLVLGSPWIFFQLWSFVAVGLYPHEKRLVNVYLPFSLLLFLLGALACEFLVIPRALGALLWFNEWLNMEPDLRFNEWLSFAILMPLVFGISFQLPLVMMFLERIGVTTVQTYVSYWKIAFFLIHVLAAFLMPSPDIFSMELLAIPMFGLYGLGILLCKLNPASTESEEETSSTEQMVEV
jgi:Tat protein translocase TatC